MTSNRRSEKLPKEYQAAFQAAAYEANLDMTAEYDFKNPRALRSRDELTPWHSVAEQTYSAFIPSRRAKEIR